MKAKQIKVLVPEAGGDAGVSAWKCLKDNRLKHVQAVYTDCDKNAGTLYQKEDFVLVPESRVDPVGYMGAVVKIIKKYKINAIL